MSIVLLLAFETAPAQKMGSITLAFDNVVGQEDVVLKDKVYTTASGEQFNITLLNYFVSNLRLQRADGSEFVVPQNESYFLLREGYPETQQITLANVPQGDYTGVRFLIGVDSLRSASDVSLRQGALDVGGEAKDMYWAWNSGYIFVKMEGTSPQVPVSPRQANHEYYYHIGLFGGIGARQTLNNLKTATVSFGGKALAVKPNTTTTAGIRVDVAQLFSGPTKVILAQNSVVMTIPFSKVIAENYANMFSFSGLQPGVTTNAAPARSSNRK